MPVDTRPVITYAHQKFPLTFQINGAWVQRIQCRTQVVVINLNEEPDGMKPGSTVHILVQSVRKAVSALRLSAFDSNYVTTRSGSSCGESTRLPSSLREILNDQTREAYVDYLVKDELM